MGWPLGYVRSDVDLGSSLDGVIFVGEAALTASMGWIDLGTPLQDLPRVQVDMFSVRLRLARDAERRAFLFAEQVHVGSRRHNGIHAMMQVEGAHWFAHIVREVERAVDACIAAPHRTSTGSRAAVAPRIRRADAPAVTVRAGRVANGSGDSWADLDASRAGR